MDLSNSKLNKNQLRLSRQKDKQIFWFARQGVICFKFCYIYEFGPDSIGNDVFKGIF